MLGKFLGKIFGRVSHRTGSSGSPRRLAALGRELLAEGDPAQAEPLLRRALELEPDLPGLRSDVGQSLRLQGKLRAAEQILREAAAATPGDQAALNRLGTVLRELGRQTEAEQIYLQALRLQPNDADILNNLGAVMSELGKTMQAEEHFRKAVAADPGHAMAQCNLGLSLADRGRQREAERYFAAAVQADPDYFYARISHVMNKLPVLHESEEEALQSRREYGRALRELRDWLPEDARTIRAAAETVGWVTPFYLAYQGKNDRDLQAEYGALICDIMARRYPEYAACPPIPPPAAGEAIRVGIVSAFFTDHSVWKTPIRGWIENIDTDRFHVYGYHTGFKKDAVTASARRTVHRFVEDMPFDDLCRRIREDKLHVLIFPEIGMDPVTTKLAALRMAPVQCNSWGHPVSSGMPTVDFYLSSDLMEPENGQDCYTERLIRLPNLSVHYTPPVYDIPALSRADLGLAKEKILYCCAQSLYKYLPQFDFVFPAIARRVPDAQFVFFSSQKSDELTAQFKRRIERAFEQERMDPAPHVAMMPRLNTGAFQAVTGFCDIYLDSIEWSGCNTTLESLVRDLPVITLRGSMMRGRHTSAFLQMMGCEELVADDLPSYIDLAVRLGNDESMRRRLKAEIPAKVARLYHDRSCVIALQDFLRSAAAGQSIR